MAQPGRRSAGDITAERDRLKTELISLAEDRKRIDLLVDERQRIIAGQERNLVGEQVRASALARDAASLKELIARMEGEVGAAKRAAEAAADEAGKPALRPSLAALERSRIACPRPFPSSEAKGLSVPSGRRARPLRQFGEDDGNGGSEKGLAPRPRGPQRRSRRPATAGSSMPDRSVPTVNS